jgi:hypothetical protein
VVEASLLQLRELALKIPRPDCEWEVRPWFDPPALPEAVAAFEQTAGFPLPLDFKVFLANTSGVVGMSVHNGYWLGCVERLTTANFPSMVAGELVVPVGTDGGGNAFLLSEKGRVWRWYLETGNVSEVATSFTAFLDRVAADWTAYVADLQGWRYLV